MFVSSLAALAFGLCTMAPAQTDASAARDAKLIAAAKQVSVHELDEALPDLAFEKWLQKESGADPRYHWEVNDCGEQTGSPAGSDPVPTCVEVDSSLKDGRQIVIFVSDDRTSDRKAPDWKIFFAQLTTPHEKINLRRLSDLPAALIRTHQPTNNPEIAK